MAQMADLLKRLTSVLGDYIVANQVGDVHKLVVKYAQLSDDALRETCGKALAADSTLQLDAKLIRTPLFGKLTRKLMALLRMAPNTLNTDLLHLALGIAAFSRAPADLPPGSRLWPEQINAALSLLTPCVLQMDTGEGKTYALLPTAFALACRYGRVYIVCANEYLAHRDALRTKPFWEFVGITPGLGLDGLDPTEWSRLVIYTTAESMMFKSLRDDLRTAPPEHPVVFGAVLLDEADAILLDDANQAKSIVENVRSADFDWPGAIEFARELTLDVDVTTNRANLTAMLTVSGEERLRNHVSAQAESTVERYLLMRWLTELAYVATRVVVRNVHYVVEDGQAHSVNRKTGRVERGVTYDWLIPLEASLGLTPRPKAVALVSCTNAVFFRQFEHVAGASGTVADDTLTYLYRYQLFTFVVPRRSPKWKGRKTDRIFATREEAVTHVCDEVAAEAKVGRPIMVGTQSNDDAQTLFDRISEELPPHVRISLLTSKNDQEMSDVFERAGEANSVLVATQLAGRGIDIRLSDESRSKGGILLIGFSHALERRLDQQFLGRAGRQGDPFTAYFVCSLEDELFKFMSGDWVKSVLKGLGHQAGEMIESKFVDGRLAGAQRTMRRLRIQTDIGQIYLDEADEIVRKSQRHWLEYHQLPEADGRPANEGASSASFLKFVVDEFLNVAMPTAGARRSELDRSSSEAVHQTVAANLRVEPRELPFVPLDIEGFTGEAAREIVKGRLLQAVQKAIAANASAREEVDQRERSLQTLHSQIACCSWIADSLEARLSRFADPSLKSEREGPPPDWSAELLAQLTALFSIRSEIGGPAKDRVVIRHVAAVQELHRVLAEENQLLAADANAIEDAAAERVQQRCAGIGGNGKLAVTARQRRIRLVGSPELLVPSGPAGQHSELELAAGVEEAAWLLGMAALLIEDELVGDGAPRASQDLAEAAAPPHSLPGSAERWRDVVPAIRNRLDELRADVQRLERSIDRRLHRRSPQNIVNWTIQRATAEFLEERLRVIHAASQVEYHALRYHRSVYDGILTRWNKIESSLSGNILHNILIGADPGRLDELFWLHDHRDVFAGHSHFRPVLRWDSAGSPPSADSREAVHAGLIERFSDQFGIEAERAGLRAGPLRRLLSEFLTQSPPHKLRTPEQILHALDEWFTLERERGLTLQQARLHRRWLRQFLVFLRERNLVGKLPTFQTRYFTWVNRMAASLSERSTLLLMLPSLGFLALFIFVSRYLTWARTPDLGVFDALSKLAFGSLLEQGSIAAPAIGGLVLGAAAMRFLQPQREPRHEGMALDRILIPTFVCLAAVWLTPWPHPYSTAGLAAAAGLLASMLALGWLLQSIAMWTSIYTGISIRSGWLIYAVPIAFLPGLARGEPETATLGYAIFAVIVIAYLAWSLLNVVEIVVVSAHVPGASDVEYFRTCYSVSGDCGSRPHVYALVLSLLVFLAAPTLNAWLPAWAAIGPRGLWACAMLVYATTVVAWCSVMLSRRCSPFSWQRTLNEQRQVLDGMETKDQMRRHLAQFRNRLLYRELAFQIGVLAAAGFLLRSTAQTPASYPVFLLIVFAAILFADQLRLFCVQCYRFAISRVAVAEHQLDLSKIKEPLEAEDRWERMMLTVKNRFEPTVTILALVFAIFELGKTAVNYLSQWWASGGP